MSKLRAMAFLVAGVSAVYMAWSERRKRRPELRWSQYRKDLSQGFDQTVTDMGDGTQVIRLRGSFEDVMSALNPDYRSDKPPLPEGLDIDGLPAYNCGCPHCGRMSVYGESTWRYHELSRTRGVMDNTTTFLAKCKGCEGFMKITVDHDD